RRGAGAALPAPCVRGRHGADGAGGCARRPAAQPARGRRDRPRRPRAALQPRDPRGRRAAARPGRRAGGGLPGRGARGRRRRAAAARRRGDPQRAHAAGRVRHPVRAGVLGRGRPGLGGRALGGAGRLRPAAGPVPWGLRGPTAPTGRGVTMTPLREALHRLREHRPPERAHPELVDAGVAFTTVGGPLERRWRQAVTTLADCLRVVDGEQVLLEGGGYDGTWLESTATAATDVLARLARADGLLPYKVTAQGPAFTQIQMVTPLARGVWHHYLRTGDRDYLATMHAAAAAHDAWLARHRDTRGTGGVEAFCTFDTG